MILVSWDDYIQKRFCTQLISMFLCVLLSLPCMGRDKLNSADSLVSLSHIRQSILVDSAARLLGKKVTVSGIANIATGLLHERYMQIYIQDDSAGLSLFSNSFDEPISVGDSLVASGEVQQYLGMTEIYVEDYDVFTGGFRLPDPLKFQKVVDSPEEYEGMLVSGYGVIQAKGNRFNGKYLTVAPTDTSQSSVMVYVSNFHERYEKFDIDKLSIGDHVQVTGILSRYELNSLDSPGSHIYKLLLRTPDDLKFDGIPKYYLWLIFWTIFGISILVLGWILLLKNQVGKQTKVIKTSLKEKEVLLQEIHHRVKNNLAIISGLIELQLDNTPDKAAQRVLKDSQVRIQSMAMVHEKLYKSATLSNVEMELYIKELVEAIRQTFVDEHKDVEIDFRLESIQLGIQQVIPCGLLINELVVNAFKHAFSDTKAPRLMISFRRLGDKVELAVADNGQGLPDNFSLDQSDSLGMMLVHTFTAELSAEVELEHDNGTAFSFRFDPETE